MAVTIDQLHVEVKDPVPAASVSPLQPPEPKVDLRSALGFVRERELRLKAD